MCFGEKWKNVLDLIPRKLFFCILFFKFVKSKKIYKYFKKKKKQVKKIKV